MKLYIENLNYKTEELELKKLFTPIGKVKSIEIIRNEKTVMGVATGYVEMVNSKDAINAIGELDKIVFRNKIITVSRVPKPLFS